MIRDPELRAAFLRAYRAWLNRQQQLTLDLWPEETTR